MSKFAGAWKRDGANEPNFLPLPVPRTRSSQTSDHDASPSPSQESLLGNVADNHQALPLLLQLIRLPAILRHCSPAPLSSDVRMDQVQPPTAGVGINRSATSVSSSTRSCITCAKAKAKCVREPGKHICERCARLHKDCQLKEPVQRKRKPAKLT
jgi:hypothetical protein